jgi:hypothetical protein
VPPETFTVVTAPTATVGFVRSKVIALVEVVVVAVVWTVTERVAQFDELPT